MATVRVPNVIQFFPVKQALTGKTVSSEPFAKDSGLEERAGLDREGKADEAPTSVFYPGS